jgi:hypothetical protein
MPAVSNIWYAVLGAEPPVCFVELYRPVGEVTDSELLTSSCSLLGLILGTEIWGIDFLQKVSEVPAESHSVTFRNRMLLYTVSEKHWPLYHVNDGLLSVARIF